ncbi:protein rolling stone-like [Branchiostoma floridae]|uniref:Protein rolling stone-like n=1 Tax=Branchiostoma floridae TaxID=7739 RepID=A0A9J7MCJ1_BRAFL|nr:protein rolling stone-like [Branchiostoma floridae]
MTCGQRMRSEFRLKLFGLTTHNHRNVFTRTPWLSNRLPFLLYRAAVCLYQVICNFTIHTALGEFQPLILIYLTEWAYFLLTLHTVVSAALCFADYYDSRSQRGPTSQENLSSDVVMTTGSTTTGGETTQTSVGQDSAQSLQIPWHYKLYWVLYNVAFSGGIFITIVFWLLLRNDFTEGSILTHAMNSVTIVMDVMVSGLPCRLLHFVHISTAGVVYILFTVVYWAAGGTGLDGQPYIYPFLDYGGNPVLAAIVAVLAVVVAIPLCHCIVFALVVARESLIGVVQRRQSDNSQSVDVTAL